MLYLLLCQRDLSIEERDIAFERGAFPLFFGKDATLLRDILLDLCELLLQTRAPLLKCLLCKRRRDERERYDYRAHEEHERKKTRESGCHTNHCNRRRKRPFRLSGPESTYSFFSGASAAPSAAASAFFSSPMMTVSGAGGISATSSLNSFTEATMSPECTSKVALGGSGISPATM